MATRVPEGEYSGDGGLIQTHPDHVNALENLADRKAVKEQAMILRRAMRLDGYATVTETRNPDTKMIDIVVEPYSEERARAELEEKH